MSVLERIGIALAALSLSGVALFAFWPVQPEDPHEGWCQQYPSACAYEDYPNGPKWVQFVEDRRSGIR